MGIKLHSSNLPHIPRSAYRAVLGAHQKSVPVPFRVLTPPVE